MTAGLVDLPKVQLHVHLESAVRWPSLHEIGAANGVDVPGHLEHEGRAFRGLPDFVEQNELIRECLRRAADFRRIALEFCEDEAAQGTRYAEITFAAVGHGERLGDLEMPLLAVLDGLAEGRDRFGIECRLILDHSRRRSVERAWRTLDLAAKYRPDGVVAIGLAGDESFPAAPFAGVFAAAPDAGLHVVHHAGEALGPDSIRARWPRGRSGWVTASGSWPTPTWWPRCASAASRSRSARRRTSRWASRRRWRSTRYRRCGTPG
jgi:adenosine deaminase